MPSWLPWTRVFADNLPRWATRPTIVNFTNVSGVCLLVPAVLGTYLAHVADDRYRRNVAVSTLNFVACAQVARIAVHAGLQSSFFGLPARTLEFHPLVCIIRYLVPLLPLGLLLVSLRSAFELPHLSARYLCYASILSCTFDSISHFVHALPAKYIRASLLNGFQLSVCLIILGSNEALMNYTS